MLGDIYFIIIERYRRYALDPLGIIMKILDIFRDILKRFDISEKYCEEILHEGLVYKNFSDLLGF